MNGILKIIILLIIVNVIFHFLFEKYVMVVDDKVYLSMY